jgi:hypothetical protein
MYLVHAQFHSATGAPWPARSAALFSCCARDDDGLEHVSAHPDAPGGPVVGLFLVAPDLDRAETAAAQLCRRAAAHHPELAPFRLLSCGVVLVPDFGSGLWT